MATGRQHPKYDVFLEPGTLRVEPEPTEGVEFNLPKKIEIELTYKPEPKLIMIARISDIVDTLAKIRDKYGDVEMSVEITM